MDLALCTGALSDCSGIGLGFLVPVKGNYNASACNDISNNCARPPLWQQSWEDPHTDIMVRCPHMSFSSPKGYENEKINACHCMFLPIKW